MRLFYMSGSSVVGASRLFEIEARVVLDLEVLLDDLCLPIVTVPVEFIPRMVGTGPMTVSACLAAVARLEGHLIIAASIQKGGVIDGSGATSTESGGRLWFDYPAGNAADHEGRAGRRGSVAAADDGADCDYSGR